MIEKQDILLIGLNHKTAPVEIRECIGFDGDESDQALHDLHALEAVHEVFLVSTCNRVEVLLTTPDKERAAQQVVAFLSEMNNIPVTEFQDNLYQHVGDDAVLGIDMCDF